MIETLWLVLKILIAILAALYLYENHLDKKLQRYKKIQRQLAEIKKLVNNNKNTKE